jgi:uncharacterized protein involved in exopolysaccharide biosynthesis
VNEPGQAADKSGQPGQQWYMANEDEIDLLDLWRVLVKRRKLIVRTVLCVVFATAVISLFMTNMYQAQTVILPVASQEGGAGGGAMLAMAEQLGGALGGLGFALPGGATAAEIVNLLKSNVLREKIIVRHNLLPVLFYQDWDEKRGRWKSQEGGFLAGVRGLLTEVRDFVVPAVSRPGPKKIPGIPDTWDALRLLDDIVTVKNDMKENTITISVEFHDPDTAARIAEYFLVVLTDHMSGEAKRVAETNRKYLEGQLDTTADPLLKQRIYAMIAQQIETSMMAEMKENFAFKVIDPPKAPDMKSKPKRVLMVVLSFVVALMVAAFGAFFLEYLEKAKQRNEGDRPGGPGAHEK